MVKLRPAWARRGPCLHALSRTLNPEPVSTKIEPGFEFPALRVMAVGSFEPTFHQSESRRRVVCMPLCEEA